MKTLELFRWMQERHSIYLKKEAGKPKPWTTDPILLSYKFCNVYREKDTVTKWIADNWRTPYDALPEIWFYMVIARLVNWPATLNELPDPSDNWSMDKFIYTLTDRKRRREQVFNSAYIVSTNGHAMDKALYLGTHVLAPLWRDKDKFERACTDTNSLEELYAELRGYNGLAGFMAAQVVADVKFTSRFRGATDFWTFAASGPGSKRGLNRVLGNPKDQPWRESEWLITLGRLQEQIDPMVAKAKMPRVSAQDLQNCLCEFDKYERTRLGEGRPRNTYPGG